MPRRFPAPWTVERIDGGWVVVDDGGARVAYVYARDDLAAGSQGAQHMTTDEAWRIAVNIAKLPDLLRRSI